jgi:2-dehydropantoate 2-reductase
LTQFAGLLSSGGALVEVHSDVQTQRWSKALINSAWNPISALSQSANTSFLSSHPDSLQMVRDSMLEIAAVAQSCGYHEIDDSLVERQLARAMARTPPGVKLSMMLDAVARKEMEVDAILGNLLAVAAKNSVRTPTLKLLFLLLNALNLGFKE